MKPDRKKRLLRESLTKKSKFLSLVLRHEPESIGLALDPEGWAKVDDLLQCANRHGANLTLEILKEIVETNEKKRFSFSSDSLRIRANQGHSIEIDLGLRPVEPPEYLYHGTALRFWPSIRTQGLVRGDRQYVHLSQDAETARKVGIRHGKPIILLIASLKMHRDGKIFYRSENGVWLTDNVPVAYITEYINNSIRYE